MKPTKEHLHCEVLEILTSEDEGWEVEASQVSPETRLGGDLGFSSIDVLHLIASIDMRLKRKLPFQRLLVNGTEYVTDVRVDELVNFVYENYDCTT
jgi:acyl carrier protein